ncbi:MAG TPA: DUF4129 domain-containing protein, partial [Burkholderiales bacterium]|nr:DUF4129 domain-containing protein [Burkholderiales bacterium]
AGLDDSTWRSLAILLIVATTLVTLLLAFFTLRNRTHSHDPALAAYRLFCRKTAHAGFPRQEIEGPVDYAARIAKLRPDLADAVKSITRIYVALRYENNINIKYLYELRQRVKQFDG